MANIKDVAKKAGVSVATVSRYLNQKGYISTDAKNVIEIAIKELGYKPNLLARSLSTKQTNLLGLIVSDITNPFFPELARAVEDVALSYGYTVILCNSDEDAIKEIQYIDTLQQKLVAGFIITTNQHNKNYYETLNVPIVALDRAFHSSFPTVSTNNLEGALIGTKHLIESGCRNIACLRGPEGLIPADDRLKGFLMATQDEDVEVQIVKSSFKFDLAERDAYQFLKANQNIDGIFASSDAAAIGALKAALSLNIRVPEELQIVGFDGIEFGKMVTPSLTTVAQDIYQMGALAARMLIKQIEGIELTEQNVLVKARLIKRGTTRSVER